MPSTHRFGPRERAGLCVLAALGGLGLNGAFAYGLLARPGALQEALRNPVALAFIAEALLLVPVLAWLLRRLGATRMHAAWFVLLALAGGLAFAVPLALLVPPRAPD